MLGRTSKEYIKYIEAYRRFNTMPYGLDVVSLGSTMILGDFDFEMWKYKGYNLANSPQSLSYDYRILKQYRNHLKKNGVVLIGLAEFSLLVPEYKQKNNHNIYYWILGRNQIVGYSRVREALLKSIPGIVDIKLIKQEVTCFMKKIIGYSNNKTIREDVTERIESWYREFSIREKCSMEQIEDSKRTFSILEDIMEFCCRNELKPVIIIPPMSNSLKSRMPISFLEDCLWKYIRHLENNNVDIIDCYNDIELSEDGLYESAIVLNMYGKELFNSKIQSELMERGYLKEEQVESSNREEKLYDVSGVMIPWIAFGTGVVWKYSRKPSLFIKTIIKNILRSIKHFKVHRELISNFFIDRVLSDAYDIGFRMYDSARIYSYSEPSIGKIVKKHPEILTITKCSAMDVERNSSPATVNGNLMKSINYLKKKPVDIYLLHWPEGIKWKDYYRDIIDEKNKGNCRIFGACNLRMTHLKELENSKIPLPMVIQAEIHPLNIQKELREYCKEHNIQLMAHTPTGRMSEELVNNDILVRLSKKYHKSIAQVIMRWHYQNNIIPIVNTINRSHMKEDLEIFDFRLSENELLQIDSLDRSKYFIASEGIDDLNYEFNL